MRPDKIRDRDGSLIDVPEPEPPRHSCTAGWLGEDDEGRPRPCPRCRPHLIRRLPASDGQTP